MRQTSNELIAENHAGQFKKLGRRNGFRLSIEPYDMNPAADLDLGAVADVPMCEFWSDGFGFNSSFSCIEATSIAHVSGLPVVAAEAFTADSPEAWKKYPGNMKNQGDWAFCMGINRLIYHTFVHKALPDKYRPGMTMGPYGVHWDRGQTWWSMAAAYHKYISRCQFVLSQGKAVADILYLTPEGAPQVFLPPESALSGTPVMPDKGGYSFDGCSPSFLIKNAAVKDHRIVFSGGASYDVIVLPLIQTMTPELITTIGELISAGATVIGNPPVRSPSLANFPECDSIVKSLADNIWGSGTIPENLTVRQYGTGKILWGENLSVRKPGVLQKQDSPGLYPDYQVAVDILRDKGLNPDFSSSGNIRYTHRSFPDRDIYFISNKSGEPVKDTCLFREGTLNAELWNPVSGETSRVECYTNADGRVALTVMLDAYQSYFVVFSHNQKRDNLKNPETERFAEKQTLFTLQGSWNVSFDTSWGGPAHIVFSDLTDWSARAEEGIKYYSGSATYTKTFDIPDGTKIKGDAACFLDLGIVRNLAEVSLNGHDLGILWTAPWQVRVTGIIKEKDNRLEVKVSNLWINRLIGDESLPWDGVKDGKWPDWLLNGTKRNSGRYTFTTHRFYKKDDPLSESGLIGPVTLTTE